MATGGARDIAATGVTTGTRGVTGVDAPVITGTTAQITTGTLSGNITTVTGPDTSGVQSPGIASTGTIAPVTPSAGDGSGGVIPGGKTLPGLTLAAPGEVVFTAPQNPLYTVASAPDSPYLVVTDPRFTNWDSFISSDYFFRHDYFFRQLQSDPQAMHKRHRRWFL